MKEFENECIDFYQNLERVPGDKSEKEIEKYFNEVIEQGKSLIRCCINKENNIIDNVEVFCKNRNVISDDKVHLCEYDLIPYYSWVQKRLNNRYTADIDISYEGFSFNDIAGTIDDLTRYYFKEIDEDIQQEMYVTPDVDLIDNWRKGQNAIKFVAGFALSKKSILERMSCCSDKEKWWNKPLDIRCTTFH